MLTDRAGAGVVGVVALFASSLDARFQNIQLKWPSPGA
jgi:hypothetical protein